MNHAFDHDLVTKYDLILDNSEKYVIAHYENPLTSKFGGIVFIGSKGESELLLGTYFGEGADGTKKYGEIDGEPIFFSNVFYREVENIINHLNCTVCPIGANPQGKCE